jgi:hypothetical protein
MTCVSVPSTSEARKAEILEIATHKAQCFGDLKGASVDDTRVDVEKAIRPQPPAWVGPDIISHLLEGEVKFSFCDLCEMLYERSSPFA